MKGMIFTTDAIFALVIVGAAISIVVYFNYATGSPYTLASGQAQSILNLLSTIKVGSLSAASFGALAQCNPMSGATVLQAAVQYYFNGSGSCATYLLDTVNPSSNYGVFINGISAPPVAQFNGQSWVVIPNSAPIDNPPSTVTVSLWMKSTTTYGILFSTWDGNGHGLQVYENSVAAVWSSGTGSLASSKVINDGAWHNVVAVWGPGSTIYIYVDGVLATSGSATFNTGSTLTNQIGVQCDGPPSTCGGYYTGSIANVQFYDTALPSGQVASLYQEGLTGAPLSNAGNAGWWPLEGDTADYSGNNNQGSTNSIMFAQNNYISPSLPNGYGASGAYGPALNTAYLNGQNSYIDAGNGALLNVPGNIVVSEWLRFNTNSLVVASAKYGAGLGWELVLNNGRINFAGRAAPGTTYQTSGTTNMINDGNWHYVVGMRSGSTWSIWVDGVMRNSTTSGTGSWATTQDLIIGGESNYGYFFPGSIADVQIYNTSLTSTQISALYQEGLAAPPISGAGNVGWWLLEGDSKDYSGFGNTGIPSNVVYFNGNYIPAGFTNSYSVSRAGTLLPFSKYASLYSSNAVYSYTPRLYSVGVYTWR